MKAVTPVAITLLVIFVLLYIDFLFNFLAYKWKSYLFNAEMMLIVIYFIPYLKRIKKNIST